MRPPHSHETKAIAGEPAGSGSFTGRPFRVKKNVAPYSDMVKIRDRMIGT